MCAYIIQAAPHVDYRDVAWFLKIKAVEWRFKENRNSPDGNKKQTAALVLFRPGSLQWVFVPFFGIHHAF